MLICINTHPAAFFLQAVESISSDSAGEPIKEEHVTLTNTPTQKPKVHRDHHDISDKKMWSFRSK